jgi:3-phenylpropionate/cinnamic acid dioxygenase small subunit
MPAVDGEEVTDLAELRELERFLIHEAALADQSRYDEWEQLLEPDMVYWVPRGLGDFDPERHVSILNDNRARIATRIRQLKTGARHAQTPVSPMRRLVSNLVARRLSPTEYEVDSNFALFEMAVQGDPRLQMWAGSMLHRLRRTPAGLRMYFKRVSLVNGDQPLPTMAFII